MIKDKAPIVTPPPVEQPPVSKIIETVAVNPFSLMFAAVKRAILTLREDPEDPASPAFFKTISVDNGQFERLLRVENMESETAFPAVFIHFTNIRYLVQQQRVGEGRANMRVRFLLNTLNNGDEGIEFEPFEVFQRINIAIQDAKTTEPALNERCNLIYFDQPSTTNMLQAYWIDYEVWFRETSAFKYRKWEKRYVVMPPFTNHPDAPDHDDHNGDHSEITYDKVIDIVDVVPVTNENSGDEEPQP